MRTSARLEKLMKRFSALACALVLLAPSVMRAQGTPRGFWPVAGGDAAHSGWQKAETQISTETVASNFKLLWKLKLGSGSSFSEPLLVPGMITGKGFKDFLFVADANTLYGVDSELGALVWQHDFKLQAGASRGCGANIQIATEAPQVIRFGAHRPAGSRPPPPPPPQDPMPAASRRVGVAAGGGYFGLKGVYAVTSDGYIHEQIMATGLDYAPPIKFLEAPGGGSFGLNMNDKIVYASQGTGCRGAANALWSIDLNTPDYAIKSYKAQSFSGLSGPSIGPDGTAYLSTGSGPADPAAHPDSVVALSANDLKVKDWYLAGGQTLNASPVAFAYKEKELVAAAGKDGTLVLLDSESLGGADHHTPLAQTEKIFKIGKHQEWESLATWQDKAGVVWILASVSGAVLPDAKFAQTNGSAPHGSVAAFKVEEKDGHTVLTPAWISRDLINPAPPVAANGIVFALEGGKTHATLYALDAATGKQLYSSGDAIHTYTRMAGMSVGDGHVFFTTHDNTLYSFGIPLEH
jgi:outer membrane protein assembly factor BamB